MIPGIVCNIENKRFVYLGKFYLYYKRVPFDENFQVEDFNSVKDVRSKMSEHDDSKYQLCVLKNIV